MSGTTYTVTCQTCGNVGLLEIYTDGWNNVKIDDSQVRCWDCEKKANPQDWFDHQCTKCAAWFNIRRNSTNLADQGGIDIGGGQLLCIACVKEVVLA